VALDVHVEVDMPHWIGVQHELLDMVSETIEQHINSQP
jgi:hypothetical protein